MNAPKFEREVRLVGVAQMLREVGVPVLASGVRA
jgi:hypothetical protein